ncbi:8791_t:CDS:2, partial [Scutellospora calospora]
ASSARDSPVSKDGAPIYDFGRNSVLGFSTEDGASDPENVADLESAISQNAVVPVDFTSYGETNTGKVSMQIDSIKEVQKTEIKIIVNELTNHNDNIMEDNGLKLRESPSEYNYDSNIILPETSEINGKLDYIPSEIQDEGAECNTAQTNDTSHNDTFSTIESHSDSCP